MLRCSGVLFITQICCWTPYAVIVSPQIFVKCSKSELFQSQNYINLQCLWTLVLPPDTLNIHNSIYSIRRFGFPVVKMMDKSELFNSSNEFNLQCLWTLVLPPDTLNIYYSIYSIKRYQFTVVKMIYESELFQSPNELNLQCLWTLVLPPDTLNIYYTLLPSVCCKV